MSCYFFCSLTHPSLRLWPCPCHLFLLALLNLVSLILVPLVLVLPAMILSCIWGSVYVCLEFPTNFIHITQVFALQEFNHGCSRHRLYKTKTAKPGSFIVTIYPPHSGSL